MCIFSTSGSLLSRCEQVKPNLTIATSARSALTSNTLELPKSLSYRSRRKKLGFRSNEDGGVIGEHTIYRINGFSVKPTLIGCSHLAPINEVRCVQICTVPIIMVAPATKVGHVPLAARTLQPGLEIWRISCKQINQVGSGFSVCSLDSVALQVRLSS